MSDKPIHVDSKRRLPSAPPSTQKTNFTSAILRELGPNDRVMILEDLGDVWVPPLQQPRPPKEDA